MCSELSAALVFAIANPQHPITKKHPPSSLSLIQVSPGGLRPQSRAASQEGRSALVDLHIKVFLRWRSSKRELGVDTNLRHASRTPVMSISFAGVLAALTHTHTHTTAA